MCGKGRMTKEGGLMGEASPWAAGAPSPWSPLRGCWDMPCNCIPKGKETGGQGCPGTGSRAPGRSRDMGRDSIGRGCSPGPKEPRPTV